MAANNTTQTADNQTVLADAPQNKSQSQNGTGFVNLNQYLNANQGNGLGSAVAGNINNAASTAQGDLSQQQNTFNQGLSQARAGLAQDQSNVAGTFQSIDNPTFNGLSPSQVQNFQNFTNNPYSGPTGFSNPQQLQQQTANASALGQLAGSRTGRQQLLAQTINSPGYTPAEQNMDELYMSLGGGQQAVQKAGQGTQQLQGQVSNAVNNAQQQGTNTANQYNQAQQQANTQVQQQQAATNAQIANAVQQDQAPYQQAETLQNALASNTLTPAQAAQLGLTSNMGAPILNVNPLNYYTLGAPPSTSNVSTPTQQAQLIALAQLAGQQAPQFNNGQAGTYSPYTFNAPGLQNAMSQAEAQYQSGLQNAQIAALAPYGGTMNPYNQAEEANLQNAINAYNAATPNVNKTLQ